MFFMFWSLNGALIFREENVFCRKTFICPRNNKCILKCFLETNSIVADIGSGTGLLTKEFVRYSYETYAVEPDRDMRKNTGLCKHSVSLITVASAFHWSNITEIKHECVRILDGNGLVCIIYNVRM